MKRIAFAALGLALSLGWTPALAQSSAEQAVTGYLSNSGCSPNPAPCFIQYGPAATQPVSGTVTANQGTAGGSPWPVTNAAGTAIIGKVGIDQTTPGTTNGVQVNAATHAQGAALASNLVAKASAGTLYSFEVSADATLSAGVWYVMIFDAASAPVDGAVTPAKCYVQPAGATQMGGTLAAGGVAFATGITVVTSTTGCFTKTASAHAFIAADYQ